MQTIHRLDEDDIKHIISEKFDVEDKAVILNSIEEITNKGKRESVISAKVIDNNNNIDDE